ncbi:CYTH domain-containing protein [Streptococcus massiliensis]|uniref:Adenylate cyclase n=1 Tax=Streptococcus massiliensis TaxID=313439 RepID=A0A380KYJ2_9STRE|nr:CYTH domain-containing protein [Streptococcus massiliensis]SUN75996.1 adenylate cyclase [Streptococcus massiliensis]
MNHLEIEFKTLLSEENYQKLLPLFADVAATKQVNYYMDTADRAMRKARIAIRIRTYPDYAELTVKIPQKNSVGNMEYNQKLTLVEAEKIISGHPLPKGQINHLLTERGIPVEKLAVLGSLTTVRYELEHEIGLLALDKSHYFDKTDYELEVEVSDEKAGKLAFEKFLAKNHIPYQAAPSKLARFTQNLANS